MKMTFGVIVAGSLVVFLAVVFVVVFIPGWIYHPAQTDIAHPYSDQEARGRKVYLSNGCNYCHTQYVRFWDNNEYRVADGGDYYFDNPMLLGSERTGPDLSYIGRKRSEAWEIQHWKDPRSLSPMSIMPSFEFLSDQELADMSAYIFNLGDRVAAEWMILSPGPYASVTDTIPMPITNTVVPAQANGWAVWSGSNLQTGKEIYIRNCLTCHGCSGNGLGHYAGKVVVTPADFKQEPFRSMPDDQWFWHVSEGIQGSVMPPWKESMSEEERWYVIRYIQHIFAQPVMHAPEEGDPVPPYAGQTNPLPPTVATLEEGKRVFIRECWVCHGDNGRGDGIYRDVIQPGPPDFGDGSYGDFTDADYFWRISEGVPWTAMPAWKVEYSDMDRWALTYYIRVNFTQTSPRPKATSDQVYPEADLIQTMPQGISAESGKAFFAFMCARCHGLAGKGDGWNGQYLDVKPADFTTADVRGLSQGDFFARVSNGLQDSAMPSWAEWIPIRNRWLPIKYIQEAFVTGMPVTQSVTTTVIPFDFLTISSTMFVDEGHPISPTQGITLYATYCSTCHGDHGQGNGPDTQGHPSGGPAAFPSNMAEQYIFWRIWEGVPKSIMPPFKQLLSDTDTWNLTVWIENGMPTKK